MRSIVVFIALLFTLALSAQDRVTTLDVYSGIGYGFRYNVDLLDNGVVTDLDDDTGRINWRAGIAVNREVGENWFLRVGLGVSSMGYRPVNLESVDASTMIDPLFIELDDPTLYEEIKLANSFSYVELPIAIRYEFGNEGVRTFAEAGLIPGFLAAAKNKLYLDDERSSINRQVDQFQSEFAFGVLVSVGIALPLQENSELYFQPSFIQHLTDTQEIPFRLSLWEAGLQAGVRYILR